MGEDMWDCTMKIEQLFMAVMSKSMAAWLSTSVPKTIPKFYTSWYKTLGFLSPMLSLGASFFRLSSGDK